MGVDTLMSPALVGFMDDYKEKQGPPEPSKDEQLFVELEAHEQEELTILKEYETAAAESSDAGFRYLMGLIIADERRHHQFTKEMTHDVREALMWLGDDKRLPAIRAHGDERARLLGHTVRFLDVEEAGVSQLEHLHEKVKGLNSGLLELIVDIMRADTKKHVQILRYIKQRLDRH